MSTRLVRVTGVTPAPGPGPGGGFVDLGQPELNSFQCWMKVRIVTTVRPSRGRQFAAPGPSNTALVLLWGTTTWTALRWTVKSAGVVVAISPSRFTGNGGSVTSRTCRLVRWCTRSCSMKLPSLSSRAMLTCSRSGPARMA